MKHFLLIFIPFILAVERCPIYRESGWKLVRRTNDNSFEATDNLDGTDVYGSEHENVFGESFSIDFTGIDYDEILFVTGDCQGWVKMDKSEFAIKADGAKNVIETDLNPYPHQLFMTFQAFQGENPRITNNDGDGDGCNLLYIEDSVNIVCSTNGFHVSEVHGGLNVFVLEKPPAPVPWSIATVQCPNDGFFQFSEIEGRCASLGKVPLTLHNNGEAMSWMMAKMMGTCPPGMYWLGLTDIIQEGVWLDNYGNEVDMSIMTATIDNAGGVQHCLGEICDPITGTCVPLDVDCDQILYQYACIDPWGDDNTCDGSDTVCTVWGNTHIATFDGNENDIYGSAIYIVSQTSQEAIQNFGFPPYRITKDTSTSSIHFQFSSQDRNIFFEAGFYSDGVTSIKINGEREMILNPQNNPNFKFEKSGTTSSIETWFGLHLVYDSGNARITVTSAFVEKISGVCGNLNCDKTDDWTLADGTECKIFDATAVSFEDVWIRDSCEFDCANSFILNPNEMVTNIGENIAGPTCDPSKYNLCDTIFDGTEFNDCRIDAVNIPRWIQNCKIEICGTVDAAEESEVITNTKKWMLDHCIYLIGDDWVGSDPCDLDFGETCPQNMVFNRCSNCDDRTSCADWLIGAAFYSSGTTVCNGDHFGTCVCETGYKLSNGECVLEASCLADEENFSDWSSWGSCSVTCGGGVSSRARFCLSDTCSGETIETLRNCGHVDCPVLGQFTCPDLGGICSGFVNSDWFDPATGDAVTVIESTKPDPNNVGQTLPIVTIDGIESITYDIIAGLIEMPPVFSVRLAGDPNNVWLSINGNYEIIWPNQKQRILRVSNDFCAIFNPCDADTTCANGISDSTCNCDVQDLQSCRRYMSSKDQGWTDMNFEDARIKCFAEGGRLMRITSILDLLNLDLGSSFDQSLFHANIDNEQWSSYGSPIYTNIWSTGSVPDGTSGECAKVVNDSGEYKIDSADCSNIGSFICEITLTTVCNQWVDLDAHVAITDQEPNDQGYFDSQIMSLSFYDGSFYSGTLDGNIVTFPDSGDWVGLDWVGIITKPKVEDCFQNKLDEYCRNLGVKDNYPVQGERGGCEDRKYARFVNDQWGCYDELLTSTSVSCIDAKGEIRIECESPDTSTTRSDTKIFGGGFGSNGFGGGFGGWGGGGFSADNTECDADQVHIAMINLIRDLKEFGCKQNDEIVFTQPDETLIRCGFGFEAIFNWKRPSSCNLCEETGFTIEYDIEYFQGDWGASISDQTVNTWLDCTDLCNAEASCETITYSFFDNNCKLYGFASSNTDATTSSNPGLYVSGRLCSNEATCSIRACESCAMSGATMERGCRYDSGSQLKDSQGNPILLSNVLTYFDCVQKCRQTESCSAITFYSKDYIQDVADPIGSPAICLLQSSVGTLTCDSINYQTVTSGRFCEDETLCINQLCDSCDETGFTVELDCEHFGRPLSTFDNIPDWFSCLALCKQNEDCIHVRYTTDQHTGWRPAQRCELLFMYQDRQCSPDTVGLITGARCNIEEQCDVTCVDVDECVLDTHQCDSQVTYNYVCSNNLGSYSCDLVPSSLLVPVDVNGNPTDGLTPWQNKDDETEVSFVLGVGLDGVTPDGTIIIDGIPGTITGLTITLANPSDSINPYVGTISADFLEITWDDNTDGKSTICRVDVDECSNGTDNCDALSYPAICSNNVGGFSCDFDPNTLLPAGNDGYTPWTDKTTGTEVTFTNDNGVISLDGMPVTISGNIITFGMATGTISDNGKEITWDDQSIGIYCRTDIDECTDLSHSCDSDVTYEYTCRNIDGSFLCDVNSDFILPILDGNGDPEDGYTKWTNKNSGAEVVIVTNPDGTLSFDGIQATVSGNSFVYIDGQGTEVTGTLSDDFKEITWTDGEIFCRVDRNECLTRTNDCDLTKTSCFNTDGSYTCNCLIDDATGTGTVWSVNGEDVNISVDGNIVTIGLTNEIVTGVISESTITWDNPWPSNGALTANIVKSSEGDTISIGDETMSRDTDECQVSSSCDASLECVNSDPGFKCCPPMNDLISQISDKEWKDENDQTIKLEVTDQGIITVKDDFDSTIGNGIIDCKEIKLNINGNEMVGTVSQDGKGIDFEGVSWREPITTSEAPVNSSTSAHSPVTTPPSQVTTSATPVIPTPALPEVSTPATPDVTSPSSDLSTTPVSPSVSTPAPTPTTPDQNGSGGGIVNPVVILPPNTGPVVNPITGLPGTGGSVAGDPHFVITYSDKKDICFDMEKDGIINIFDDYETDIRVDGEIIKEFHVSHSRFHQAISHRLGKIFIEKKDQYQIVISNRNVVVLDISAEAYTNTTYALSNTFDFTIGSTYVSIESLKLRDEPLVYVNMDAFEFSIAVKQRKNSLKFYIHRLPRRKSYGGLLGFGLSNSYEILSTNILKMNDEIYQFEESKYCLKLQKFDIYSKMIKHQEKPPMMMKLHAQLDPK